MKFLWAHEIRSTNESWFYFMPEIRLGGGVGH
jgi:hypothetical protein